MVDGVSPDTAALLGHIVVVAKTVLAGRPLHQPNVAAGVGRKDHFKSRTFDTIFPAEHGSDGMGWALDELCERAEELLGDFRLRVAGGDQRRGGIARRGRRQVLLRCRMVNGVSPDTTA